MFCGKIFYFYFFFILKNRKYILLVLAMEAETSENPSFVSVLTFWNIPSTFEKMSLYLKILHYSCRVKRITVFTDFIVIWYFHLPDESEEDFDLKYIYIYIEREREREREPLSREWGIHLLTLVTADIR